MGVLRINQNPYNEFISSGSTTKKGQRQGGKKRKKGMRKEKGRGDEGKEKNREWSRGRRERMNRLQRYLCPGNYIVAIQRNL